MSFLFNLSWLTVNFVKGVFISGLDTARIILRNPGTASSGTTRMAYGDLDPGAAAVLGALVSLTPGTTMIAQDTDRREFVLHLLDLNQRDATIAAIRRDFLTPLRRLTRRPS